MCQAVDVTGQNRHNLRLNSDSLRTRVKSKKSGPPEEEEEESSFSPLPLVSFVIKSEKVGQHRVQAIYMPWQGEEEHLRQPRQRSCCVVVKFRSPAETKKDHNKIKKK